jgi:hypothetical protein
MGCGAATQAMVEMIPKVSFTIDVLKEEGIPLGVALQNVDGCVVVAALSTSGIMQRHNEKFPDKQVLPGDKIVAINGVQEDYWCLVPKMWEVGRISLTIQRDMGKEHVCRRTASRVYLSDARHQGRTAGHKLHLRCPVDTLPHKRVGDCGATECAICFEDYEDADTRVVCLPCNHVFHPVCAARWFVQGTRCCPLCKRTEGLDVLEKEDSTERQNLS